MAEERSYNVITRESEGFYSEKGSKFPSFAYPVTHLDEVKPIIEALKKHHHTAVHICFGHVIGTRDPVHRAVDDGEPSNSAGTPILNQIKVRNLYNTLVAVVRYYGGTKLGVPGLINAYKTAAADALDNNTIVQKSEKTVLKLTADYEKLGDVLRLVDRMNGEIIERKFEQNARLLFAVNNNLVSEIRESTKPLKIDEPEVMYTALL